jgi:molybdate transport system permease protein
MRMRVDMDRTISKPTAISAREKAHTHGRIQAGNAWLYLSLPLLLFLTIPLVALLLRTSPSQVWANLGETQVQQALRLSISTTLVTLLLTLVFGTPAAYLLAHSHSGVRRVVDTIIDLPTVLPPAVAGLALLMAFGRRGLLGGTLSALGIQIPFTPVAVVLAQSFVASPYFIRAAVLGFSGVDTELRNSAALDGAGEWQIFHSVMLPMAWTSLVSGGVMSWARALGEFGATIIFAGNFPGRTQTMPLSIYLGFEVNLNAALTLSVILLGISFFSLLVVKLLFQKENA